MAISKGVYPLPLTKYEDLLEFNDARKRKRLEYAVPLSDEEFVSNSPSGSEEAQSVPSPISIPAAAATLDAAAALPVAAGGTTCSPKV